jgi:hypothetical protein
MLSTSRSIRRNEHTRAGHQHKAVQTKTATATKQPAQHAPHMHTRSANTDSMRCQQSLQNSNTNIMQVSM